MELTPELIPEVWRIENSILGRWLDYTNAALGASAE